MTNPYNKFKGLYNKNYSPFNFFDKNKTANSNKSGKSNNSVKSGSSFGSVDSNRNTKRNPSPFTKSVASNKSGGNAGAKKTNFVPKSYNTGSKIINNKITPKVPSKNSISNGNNFKTSVNPNLKPQVVKNPASNSNTQNNFKNTFNSGSNLNSNGMGSGTTPNQNQPNQNNFINQNEDKQTSNKVIDIGERLGRLQNMLNIAKN
jgi:hypothetical protein